MTEYAQFGAAEPEQQFAQLGPEEVKPETVAQPKPTKMSGFEAGARAYAQGATFGFSDEAIGLLKAIASQPEHEAAQNFSELAKQLPPEAVKPFWDRYAQYRDEQRVRDAQAEAQNPEAFRTRQIVGGVLSAPMLPVAGAAKGAGWAATIGKGALVGAGVGATAGLGASTADLTKGDVGGAARDTTVGALVGAAVGGIAGGISKSAGTVRDWFRGAKSATREVADKLAPTMQQPEAVRYEQPKSEYLDKSRDLEKEVGAITGKPYTLTASQAQADPSLALAEQKAWNNPATMNAAQRNEALRRKASTQAIDYWTNQISSRPGIIGKEGVAENMANAVNGAADKIHQGAVANYTEGLANADRITQGARVVPMDPLQKELGKLSNEYRAAPSAIRGVIKKTLEDLHQFAGGGKASITDVNAQLKYWGQVAYGAKKIDSTLSTQEQKWIGGQIKDAITACIDAVPANSIPGQAVDQLVNVRASYKVAMDQKDAILTDAIQKALGIGKTQAPEKVVPHILAQQNSTITGMMKVVKDLDPALAKDLQAELWESFLTSNGKPTRGAEVTQKFGVGRLAQALDNPQIDAEGKFRAIFADNMQAQAAFRKTVDLVHRLAFGAGIKGSPTYSLFMQEASEHGIADTAAEMAAKALPGGEAINTARKLVSGALGGDRLLQKALHPDNIQNFNAALELAIRHGPPKPGQASMIKALAADLGMATHNISRKEGTTDGQ